MIPLRKELKKRQSDAMAPKTVLLFSWNAVLGIPRFWRTVLQLPASIGKAGKVLGKQHSSLRELCKTEGEQDGHKGWREGSRSRT